MEKEATYLAVGTAGEIQVERTMSGDYFMDTVSVVIKRNGETILELNGEDALNFLQASVQTAKEVLDHARELRIQHLETRKAYLIEQFGQRQPLNEA